MIYRFLQRLKSAAHRFLVEPSLKKGLGSCGKNTRVEYGCDFQPLGNIFLGSNVSVSRNARFWTNKAKIKVEDYALFGPGVTILTGDHRTDLADRHICEITEDEKLPENDADVVIEEGAWIGANAVILKGVTVGKGSVIGAGSIVTKSTEPFAIYGGNPAKKIKNRFENLNNTFVGAKGAPEGGKFDG